MRLDPAQHGADCIIWSNSSFEGDAELVKWINTTDFRRALSLGIDRDQLNETFSLGTGTPDSPIPADEDPLNPGPEYRKLWHTLDVTKANCWKK